MTPVRLHSSYIRSGAVFKVPILFWTKDVPQRFFRALYGALNEMLYIQPSDFVAHGGASLGDCSAALRIFGGNSTFTLKANMMIVEFPSVAPERNEFVDAVTFRGFQALRTEFSELEITSIEANAGQQIEITGDNKAQDLLACGSNTELRKRSVDLGKAVVEPGMRFRLVSKDGKWHSKVTVEKSEAVENGIFLLRETVISDLSDCETTQQKFDLIRQIDLMIVELVGLKSEVQGNADN